MISTKGKQGQSIHRKEILRSKIREIQRLGELERQHMAETGYRKRIAESRDLYRYMLNDLYLRDLDAQVELNKRIQAYRDQKEASVEKSNSGLPDLGWATPRSSCKRDLNEEVRSAMCARETRILAVAEEKRKEFEDMQRLEQARLADEQKAAEVALARRKMLQCCFERQIQEKCRAIQKRQMEEAVASKWLISNDTQLGLQMDEAFTKHKATTRDQTRRFLEYSRWLKEEKQLEEKKRADAFEVTSTNIRQTTEAKQTQLREASQALEKGVREMQFEQMQKREQVRPTQPDGGPSFLDKMFARDAMESRRMKLAKHQYHLDLLQQIQQHSDAATPVEQEPKCCDFTRPFARSQDDSSTYEHLNPLRRSATSQS